MILEVVNLQFAFIAAKKVIAFLSEILTNLLLNKCTSNWLMNLVLIAEQRDSGGLIVKCCYYIRGILWVGTN